MGERVGIIGMCASLSWCSVASDRFLSVYCRSVVLDESTLRTSYANDGHASGHLTFEVPGANALIDTYVVVSNGKDVDQASLNSTLRWSTTSHWTSNGDILFYGDVRALKTASQTWRSWRAQESLVYGANQYRASSYLYQDSSETLSAIGEGRYLIESGYNW